ncbi:MAG: tyrosine--tRNA ligase [Actinobacteria bacterium]|nr:tyrosine--tRNA ligase [Actinomycetota bacterium]NBY15545.1 tyrosine--tRNA ligase [Actinomycetota bacterium]
MSEILSELGWRNLIAQHTPELPDELAKGPLTLYCGFDPTAPSLHMGNLAQIITMARFQRLGHTPIALVGGATGLIGDPSGKNAERTLNTSDVVANWVEKIRGQLEPFFDFSGTNACIMANNYDWTHNMDMLTFLREIGKHFSVNRMLDKESVSARLNGAGISYTEFSYQILQSLDYLELYRKHGCTLQIGGSDQWGNITAGTDLVRRVESASVNGLTTPLVTKADGTKFGKTESGTVWLDPELTSPYAFHQFWVNADDRDVDTLLRTFTFRSESEIAELAEATQERPHAREAQRTLANDVTTLVHGEHQTAQAKAAASALFGQGEIRDLDPATLDAAMREAPNASVAPSGQYPTVAELLVACELVASNSAGRRAINEGGVSINNVKVTDENYEVTEVDFLHGKWLVLRRGKRTFGGITRG